MARLLPSTSDATAADDAGPRVIGLDTDAADDLLSAVSSGTARTLLAALHDEPAAPSELTDHVDTSLQNVQYHLEKLEDAGVVEVVDTVYSEKGREMKVYAPADKPLVVVAGGEEETAGLRTAITSLLGGLGVLAIVGVVLNRVLSGSFFGATTTGGAVAPAAPEGDVAVQIERAATATPAAGGGPLLPVGLLTAPGTLFFAGGAVVLALGFLVWYLRR